jgi:Raf kinase inhibitor-like YbhB/YbcL family protein
MPARSESILTLTVESAAFGANGTIPDEHAAEGNNVSPPLEWSTPPPGTQSIALIVEDPDAPGRTFVHWIVVGIPADVTSLDAGRIPEGAVEGVNDAGTRGWYGPKPPSGSHRYVFKVFALDNKPDRPGIRSKHDFYNAVDHHVLAQGELIGVYERKTGPGIGPRDTTQGDRPRTPH